ncbi:YcgN family cysteine cluster protein [Novosphingobium umbonatum]|uniref:YcgN family cysteine cluster protein n=1 Tax=Novosphingobium umbonatum TaxID=1908524 RepID=A0A437N432_9SPHN|nr:YcgN family cysteine cluster protein [Novosphingobium umbonatum]RVU04677.1 YcgN family cysteine cluster protein [Novosphingobium umbonatum]
MRAQFWTLPLAKLDKEEWEALCDGCGQCCLHKVEDEDTGDIYMTNVSCKLLDLRSGQCSDYKHRKSHVPDCIQLTRRNVEKLDWLPTTCAYRLRADNLPLPDWHYLLSGDREGVHKAGVSVRGAAIPEGMAGPLHQHIIWPEGMAPMEIEEEDE